MLRICTESDFEIIYEIINDAAMAYKGVIPDDCFKEPYMSVEELHEAIADGVVFWGYEDEGNICGVMGIQDVKDVTLIRHAYVRTSHRNQGIGGVLLRHLLGLAVRPVLIGTWRDAVWAIRFYEKYGFKVIPVQETQHVLSKYWRISKRQTETSVVLFKT
jgi:GNAT superfamily N-acetyltransferase